MLVPTYPVYSLPDSFGNFEVLKTYMFLIKILHVFRTTYVPHFIHAVSNFALIRKSWWK